MYHRTLKWAWSFGMLTHKFSVIALRVSGNEQSNAARSGTLRLQSKYSAAGTGYGVVLWKKEVE